MFLTTVTCEKKQGQCWAVKWEDFVSNPVAYTLSALMLSETLCQVQITVLLIDHAWSIVNAFPLSSGHHPSGACPSIVCLWIPSRCRSMPTEHRDAAILTFLHTGHGHRPGLRACPGNPALLARRVWWLWDPETDAFSWLPECSPGQTLHTSWREDRGGDNFTVKLMSTETDSTAITDSARLQGALCSAMRCPQ